MKRTYQISFLLFSIVILGASLFFFIKGQDQTESLPSKKVSTHVVANKYKNFETEVSFSAIGDVLLHSRVYNDAKQTDGSYDFNPMLEGVKSELNVNDITMANQESMMGGVDIGLSTYPSFNSPYEIGEDLKGAGIDIVNMANNHTLDRGMTAVENATHYYKKLGITYVGAYQSENDANTLRVLSVKGIKIGFLSYTYGTNGIPIPDEHPYVVNMIDELKIINDMKEMKSQSDVIIVNLHWGNEYQRYPTNQQKELANSLAKNGADVIVGHHSHVLQPIEWLDNGNGGQSLVVYSLGNFLSGQVGDYKDIGGIFNVKINKKIEQAETITTIKEPSFIPTIVTSSNRSNYRVQLLENINKQQNEEILAHMYQWINQ
ncbi:CapA family protein [Bacillus carboniphilus]|uniref:CapA family protein n=1 Tax=Bacillus carboniphilus TaxID=86663 RepID=A0ABY9JVJ5_9BACI|nr:CapA family protein [Bacillus carboniphilus]WLR43434.1 CapA family protein [Bacillus carboniphilus]